MRIAIVTETFVPQVNGIVRMLLAYLAYLERQRHEAIVFAPGEGARRCQGFEVVRVTGRRVLPHHDLGEQTQHVQTANQEPERTIGQE